MTLLSLNQLNIQQTELAQEVQAFQSGHFVEKDAVKTNSFVSFTMENLLVGNEPTVLYVSLEQSNKNKERYSLQAHYVGKRGGKVKLNNEEKLELFHHLQQSSLQALFHRGGPFSEVNVEINYPIEKLLGMEVEGKTKNHIILSFFQIQNYAHFLQEKRVLEQSVNDGLLVQTDADRLMKMVWRLMEASAEVSAVSLENISETDIKNFLANEKSRITKDSYNRYVQALKKFYGDHGIASFLTPEKGVNGAPGIKLDEKVVLPLVNLDVVEEAEAVLLMKLGLSSEDSLDVIETSLSQYAGIFEYKNGEKETKETIENLRNLSAFYLSRHAALISEEIKGLLPNDYQNGQLTLRKRNNAVVALNEATKVAVEAYLHAIEIKNSENKGLVKSERMFVKVDEVNSEYGKHLVLDELGKDSFSRMFTSAHKGINNTKLRNFRIKEYVSTLFEPKLKKVYVQTIGQMEFNAKHVAGKVYDLLVSEQETN